MSEEKKSEEEKEELLEQIRKELNITTLPEGEVDSDTGLTISQKVRLVAQGALLNFSDEAVAAIRAIGPETYSEALEDERFKV